MGEPLLLHSLTFYADLIGRLASVSSLPDVVEIGSQAGEMSEHLAEAAAERQGHLHVIEPFPSQRLLDLSRRAPSVRVIEGRSPAALAGLPAAGLYVLDGDHNYATARGELRAILDREGTDDSIVVMHDVGWPWGRRDMYYEPSALAPDDVHPHSFTRGVVLDGSLAAEGRGFRSEGHYAIALHEGGPRNGVLTAIEDALAEHGDVALMTTPLVFGLAVLMRRSAAQFEAVESIMAPYIHNPTLGVMERNRIVLFLETLELRDRQLRSRAGRWKARAASVRPVGSTHHRGGGARSARG